MKKFIFMIFFGLLLLSCARVGSPVGGKKDTIPPKFLGANMDTARTNVPLNIHELRLDFDEYVNLKDISKNLIISPPIKKIKRILPSAIANKYVLIQWEDTLKANTTYSFNFGNSIVDNNEGNPLPYFNYAFSTGDKIDNLYISGEVKDALSPKAKGTDGKQKNIVVGLYRQKDSVNFRQKPEYITKADEDGYYELNYLSPGDYRILAFEDDNQNSTFDTGKENVGFQVEPLHVEKNISGLNLKIYPSKKAVRYKEMKETNGGILMVFEGKPQSVDVVPLTKPTDYKVTHRPKSDTVNIWFDAVKEDLGQKIATQLKFRVDNGKKQDTASIYYKYNSKNEFLLSNSGGNLVVSQRPFKIDANLPVEKIYPEKWKLAADSTQQNFNAKISETNPRQILVTADFVPGKKYQLTVPRETVESYYQILKKSFRFDFEIEREINLGSFTLNLTNTTNNKRWIQFLNDKDEVLFSRYTADTKLKFDEIKPGSYTLRVLEDTNGNGIWDESDFTAKTFAEDVHIFPKTIEIKPLWEIVENWDLKTDTTSGETKSK